jgi:hypothetical protein
MGAIAGTISQSQDFYPGTGLANQLTGVVANAAETTGWAVDNNRGEVYKFTISNLTTKSVIASGLTNPNSCALSKDESSLYILQQNGKLFTLDPSAGGTPSQIADFGSTDTQWRFMKLDSGGCLYLINATLKALYRYNLQTSVFETLTNLPQWPTGLGFDPTYTWIYFFVSTGGPGTNGPLCRWNIGQGRLEIVAGTSTNSLVGGEAFLVASFAQVGDIAIDSSGDYAYCGCQTGSNARLVQINGGQVTLINVGGNGSVGGSGSRSWFLRSANKLLYTNGSTFLRVLT